MLWVYLLIRRLFGLYKFYLFEGLSIELDRLKTINPIENSRVIGIVEIIDNNPEYTYKGAERVNFGIIKTAEELGNKISEYQMNRYFTIRRYPDGTLEYSMRWVGFEVY